MTSLRNTCRRRRAERIEQLLAVGIDGLDAGIGGERRHHQGERGRDRHLGGEADAEHQHDERRQRELGQRLEADDVGLHDRRIIARPPERQAERRAGDGADEKADDGRAEGEADVGPGIAGGEEDLQRLEDRARLRPEERVDEAGGGADFPQRDDADEDAELHADDDPGRPVLLHRQLARRLRPHGGAAASRARWASATLQGSSLTGEVCSIAMASAPLRPRHRGRPAGCASRSRQRSFTAMKSGAVVQARRRGRGSATGIVSMMRPGRVPIT